MAWQQSVGFCSTGSGGTIAVTFTPTAGNLLAVAVVANGTTVSSIATSNSDTIGNSGSNIFDVTNSSTTHFTGFFIPSCVGGSTTVTATLGASATALILVTEYSGRAGTYDAASAATHFSSSFTNSFSGPVNAANVPANSDLWAPTTDIVYPTGTEAWSSIGGGFTSPSGGQIQGHSGGGGAGMTMYQNNVAAGTYTPSASLSEFPQQLTANIAFPAAPTGVTVAWLV